MTKREAKRYVARMASRMLRNAIDNADEWLVAADDEMLHDYRGVAVTHANDHTEANERRLNEAVHELADELARRGAAKVVPR